MAFQFNASGDFQDDHWYTSHIYLITSKILEGSKNHNVTETRQGTKILSKFTSDLPPVHDGQTISNIFLNTLQKHTDERGMLNESQFGFRVRHRTTAQCMRLTDHVTLNFDNKISTAAVFLAIERLLIPHGTLACYTSYPNWNF
jgi:hypothetical protein